MNGIFRLLLAIGHRNNTSQKSEHVQRERSSGIFNRRFVFTWYVPLILIVLLKLHPYVPSALANIAPDRYVPAPQDKTRYQHNRDGKPYAFINRRWNRSWVFKPSCPHTVLSDRRALLHFITTMPERPGAGHSESRFCHPLTSVQMIQPPPSTDGMVIRNWPSHQNVWHR